MICRREPPPGEFILVVALFGVIALPGLFVAGSIASNVQGVVFPDQPLDVSSPPPACQLVAIRFYETDLTCVLLNTDEVQHLGREIGAGLYLEFDGRTGDLERIWESPSRFPELLVDSSGIYRETRCRLDYDQGDFYRFMYQVKTELQQCWEGDDA